VPDHDDNGDDNGNGAGTNFYARVSVDVTNNLETDLYPQGSQVLDGGFQFESGPNEIGSGGNTNVFTLVAVGRIANFDQTIVTYYLGSPDSGKQIQFGFALVPGGTIGMTAQVIPSAGSAGSVVQSNSGTFHQVTITLNKAA